MCEITLSVKNNKDLLMTVALTAGSSTTNLDRLHDAFTSSAYASYALIDDAFEQLLQSVSGELEENKPANKLELSKIIASALDGTLSVDINDDEMSAILHLTTAQGGRDICYADVIQYLNKNGIVEGVNDAKIRNLVRKSLVSQGGNVISREVARGKNCENGNDGYIKYLVEDPINKILRPKEINNGKVDMRELGGVVYIKEGTKLAKLVPPTKGKNGITVRGKTIEAINGEEYFIEETEGSSFVDEDKTILIANMSGMPKHLERSVSVNPLLETDNVDVGTGNIKFDGSIFVKGDACENMKLYATGDVIIGGLVESAFIKARGDLCITQGVIGRQIVDENGKTKNNTIIQAKGNINAQFVQYADMSSQSTISVVQYISHSQVIVEGDLWVGKKDKADGKLFGSCIKAGASIFVGVLGSPCGDTTSINLNYWDDRLTKSREKIKEKEKHLIDKTNKISGLIKKLKSNTSKDKELLLRLDNALKQHLTLLVRYTKYMHTKESKASVHLKELEISAYKGIFTGVDITIADKSIFLKRDHDATSVNWTNNKINFEPIIISP